MSTINSDEDDAKNGLRSGQGSKPCSEPVSKGMRHHLSNQREKQRGDAKQAGVCKRKRANRGRVNMID